MSGGRERYDDKWVPVADAERLKLSKVEGQVWLTLYQLLLNDSCQKKYEFSSSNKATLLKVERAETSTTHHHPRTLHRHIFALTLPLSLSLAKGLPDRACTRADPSSGGPPEVPGTPRHHGASSSQERVDPRTGGSTSLNWRF